MMHLSIRSAGSLAPRKRCACLFPHLWVALTVLLALLPIARPAFPIETQLVSSVALESRNGPDEAILKAIARALNAPLDIRYAPFKRRLQQMRDGEIDYMAGLLKRPERETYIHYLAIPYKQRSDTVFIVRQGQARLIRTYDDLYRLRVGTNLGSQYFPKFDNDARLNKEAVANGASNIKKLLMGRIDTVVYPESAGIDLIYKLGIGDRVAMAGYRFAGEKHVFIGVSKQSHLMARINTVEALVRSMIESGEIRRIIVDYYLRHNLPVPAL